MRSPPTAPLDGAVGIEHNTALAREDGHEIAANRTPPGDGRSPQ